MEAADPLIELSIDSAQAQFPTRTLRIEQVVDLLHVSHVPERVEEYRQAMLRGDRFPPISVVRLAGRFFIADGHKRFSACKMLPVRHVLVEVWSIRRLLSDLLRQQAAKTRQVCLVMARSFVDPRARRQGVRLFWDWVGHWKRIAVSLARR